MSKKIMNKKTFELKNKTKVKENQYYHQNLFDACIIYDILKYIENDHDKEKLTNKILSQDCFNYLDEFKINKSNINKTIKDIFSKMRKDNFCTLSILEPKNGVLITFTDKGRGLFISQSFIPTTFMPAP